MSGLMGFSMLVMLVMLRLLEFRLLIEECRDDTSFSSNSNSFLRGLRMVHDTRLGRSEDSDTEAWLDEYSHTDTSLVDGGCEWVILHTSMLCLGYGTDVLRLDLQRNQNQYITIVLDAVKFVQALEVKEVKAEPNLY
ncbi:hypothetical protein EX30DRAFT_352026 [Ascodesmis nigricans]|uniref:Uncharacterized protein n=1 Tax=Ascodesmis nigricans TaxID=341454 RepID=A0A4V3SHR5_9PEZI|nr:hypothetical protein EX30DRAFT_352026 [Ascodesmis nigricans]